MGLDILVYEHAAPIDGDPIEDIDDRYDAGQHHAWVYTGFEQSARGYPIIGSDDGGGGRSLGPWMQGSGRVEGFSAGSYSGYGEFREALSAAVLGVRASAVWNDPDAYRDKPFFELINFADNDGVIGCEAAADLAEDFRQHREAVLEKWDNDVDRDWLRSKYDKWLASFELASVDGMVVFR